MHEVNEKAKKICALKDTLMCQVTPYIESGVFCNGVPGEAVGEVVDMIKDLCDAEKNLYKACYYKTVTEAMKKAETDNEEWAKMIAMAGMVSCLGQNDDTGRMGYDNWRYASGRFAPTGKGHYAGYMPQEMRYPEFMDPVAENEEMLQKNTGLLGSDGKDRRAMQGNAGYPHRSMNPSRHGRYGFPMDDKHGLAYNEYEDARKYYHESKDPEAKKEMEEHAKHHLEDVIETTEDIWEDAKPETRKEFKEHMMKLLKDMPTN